MSAIAVGLGRPVLDLGCGSGFHLPRFASSPAWWSASSRTRTWCVARRRTRALANVPCSRAGPGATATGRLGGRRSRTVAYFFGPGCEPGLGELDRVVRRGGTAFVIDNDATRSTFGRWFRRGHPTIDPVAVERFWSGQGWTRVPVDIEWRFDSRADLEAVVRIEFTPEVAEEVLAEHSGTKVDYAVNLWSRSF